MNRNQYIEEILASFGALKRSLHAQFSASGDELGVSAAQLHLLFNLDCDEALKQSELAKKLRLTSGALTQIIEPLVQKGLLKRQSDASDRRVSRVCLTKLGASKIDRLKHRSHAAFKSALAELTVEELKAFLAIERKIINSIDEIDQSSVARKKEK